MNLSHLKARQYIEQAADAGLRPELKMALDQHLKGCAECRAFAVELAGLETGLRGALQAQWPAEGMPSQKEAELVKQLQAQFGKPGSPAGGPRPSFQWLLGILLAVGLGAWLFGARGGGPLATTETETLTATAGVTTTPAASATALSDEIVVLVAVPSQNVNCREGNSSQFEIADTLLEGRQYSPEARGTDNLWLRFVGPTFQTLCWAFNGNLNLFINDDRVELVDVPEHLLPYAEYPPTPIPSATPTFTPEPNRPQCSDGIDNDGDGRIDYIPGGAGDRECASPDDDDEGQ